VRNRLFDGESAYALTGQSAACGVVCAIVDRKPPCLMPRRLATAIADDRTGSTGELDAAGLQALARASLTGDPSAEEAAGHKRGPFRPGVWLNARERARARLSVHYFHAIDGLVVVIVTLLSLFLLTPQGLAQARVGNVLPVILGAVVTLGLMRSIDIYRFGRDTSGIIHLGTVGALVMTGALVAVATGLVLGGTNAALWLVWPALLLVSLYGLHLCWLELIRRMRTTGALTPNVVLVGATKHAEAMIREAMQRRDLNIIGVFDDRMARSPKAVEGVPVLGDSEALMSHRILPYVDRVVLAIDPRAEERVRDLTRRLGALPNPVSLLVDTADGKLRAAAMDRLARTRLARLNGPVDDDRRAFNKRLQDMIIGGIALILLIPVMAVIAVLVKMDSPGPAFFRQRRHGFNHEEIVVWKFRTMKQEAADATASRQVTHDDDRITRLGKVLRSTSLDELPQLLNVLRGEMSLVGPRPHAIGMKTGQVESARLVADYAHRHRIKPGMTGWAAIKGSRGPLHTAQDVRRRVQLDVEYVERQSFWMDLWIMMVTVPVLLGDRLAVR
jgi:polysaccharide biosynthesis protein PslA